MIKLNTLDDVVEYIKEELGEDYSISSFSPKYDWATLSSMQSMISIEVHKDEDSWYATASATTLGFSGYFTSGKLSIPNKFLYTVVAQLETIKYFLPEDNINDHYFKVCRKKYLRKQGMV